MFFYLYIGKGMNDPLRYSCSLGVVVVVVVGVWAVVVGVGV